MSIRSLLSWSAAAVAAISMAACSSEEAPTWLEELASEAAVATTTTPPSTIPAPTTTLAPGSPTAALELEKGTCLVDVPFLDGDPVEVLELHTVRCRDTHQAEIFDVIQLAQQQGEPFPGGELARQSRSQCRDRFEAFVGIPWTASELDFATLRPTADSWEQGDRAVVCALFRPDGKDLEGTTRNAKY